MGSALAVQQSGYCSPVEHVHDLELALPLRSVEYRLEFSKSKTDSVHDALRRVTSKEHSIWPGTIVKNVTGGAVDRYQYE